MKLSTFVSAYKRAQIACSVVHLKWLRAGSESVYMQVDAELARKRRQAGKFFAALERGIAALEAVKK